MPIVWKTGVYLITNTFNGKVYVGSAASGLDCRLRWHKRMLNTGKHNNAHLQRAWDKYGGLSFEFSILIRCPPEDCLKHEQVFIDQFKAANKEYGYNVNPTAGSNLGMIWGSETKAKLSAAGKGRKHTKEHCERIAASLKGKKKSAEHVAKMALMNKGKSHSEEHKKAISDGLKEKWKDEEYRNNIISKITGKKRTPESKKKMSLAWQRRVVCSLIVFKQDEMFPELQDAADK